MSQQTLETAVLTLLEGEHRPLHIETLVSELVRFGGLAIEAYPICTADEVRAALDQLAKRGSVSIVGERVAIVRDRQRQDEGMLF